MQFLYLEKVLIQPTKVTICKRCSRIKGIKGISQLNLVSIHLPMLKHVLDGPVEAVDKSVHGVLLHVPDAPQHLLHHLEG